MEDFEMLLMIATALLLMAVVGLSVVFARTRSKLNRLIAYQEEKQIFAHFPEVNPHPIMRFSHQGQLLFANPASEPLKAYWHLQSNGYLPNDWVALIQKSLKEKAQQEIDIVHEGHAYLITLMPIANHQVVNCYGLDITDKQKAMEDAHKKTVYDLVTGLPNRTLILDYLRMHAERLQPKNLMFVFMITINDLTEIASTHSDDVIADLLRAMKDILEEIKSTHATIGKPSDRSFVMIDSQLFNHGQAINLAHKILSHFSEPILVANRSFLPNISIGISVYPDDSENPDIILRNAKLAQSRVAAQNKQVLFYQSDMDEQVQLKRKILVDLHSALNNHELMLYYQPQWSISKDKYIGAEALLRWRHPTRGFVSPFFFVAAAEESGLIVHIGEWVLETAARDAAKLKAQKIPFKMAVNLSAVQFMQEDIIDKILGVIQKHDISPSMFELEITEGVVIQDVGKAIEKMHELRKWGFSLAIDDFGTGYSSLSYLQQFPVQKLKIDRAFIKDMDTSKQSFNMTRGIIELGHSLNLTLVAEGVENQKHVSMLESMNCDIIQGYHFCKPLPFDEMLAILSKQPNI